MEPFDLEDAVSRQQWGWLLDLPRRLNIIIEVVDLGHTPMFPAASTPGAAAFRRVLSAGDPSLRSAISAVMFSSTRQPVEVDGFEAVCFGLSPTGALVLARASGSDPDTDSRQELEMIGAWLTAAIESNLARSSGEITAEPYRIASLARILNEAKSRGSARSVIGAFVEALDVWDRVQVRGYVAGAHGRFLPYAAPTTASRAHPVELDDDAVPRHTRMIRLSGAEVERLGVSGGDDDVLVRRIATGTTVTWLLVFAGRIDVSEQVRLTIYSEMLREALDEVIGRTVTRVVAAITRPLPLKEPLEEAAAGALVELTAAVGGHHGALAVTTAAGGQAISIGRTDLLAEREDDASPDRLRVTATNGGLTLVVAREQGAFTALDREILSSAAAVVHGWTGKSLERRRQFRPVDALFEELAAKEVQAGRQASVIVISVGATTTTRGLLTAWLGKIRGELRSWDYAGILSETEIAVLLCDASPDQTAAVTARLKELMESDDAAGRFIRPGIGVTTCSAESPFGRSALDAARAGAAAHLAA
jgi:hypothetical protein